MTSLFSVCLYLAELWSPFGQQRAYYKSIVAICLLLKLAFVLHIIEVAFVSLNLVAVSLNHLRLSSFFCRYLLKPSTMDFTSGISQWPIGTIVNSLSVVGLFSFVLD